MTRLTRKNLKVFASNATNNGVFGSLQANNPTISSDIETLQSLPAWQNGWNSATESSEKLPPLEESQAINYVGTYQMAYILQEGVPEWLSTCEYHAGSWVKSNASGKNTIYESLVDNNIGNAVTDTSKWEIKSFDDGQVRNIGERVTSTVPQTDAGLHLLDGSLLSGSGSYSDFVAYMADLYDSGSYANLFTTEANWQTSVTNYGSCRKYVYDSVNNTVRLPKYTDTHGALIYKNSSGNTWIKIYEDGWCEQGNITSQSNQSTVTLLKSFVDTNYDVLITTNDATYSNYSYCCAVAKTTSTFNISVVRSGSGITALVYWEAKGYVDVSDYQKAPIYEYIVVATSTKTNIEVDIDQLATDLNGKADVDLSNCTKPHVVETYSSGTDWYRIWSDGWCEQGGTTTSTTVTFLVEMADTNYNFSFGQISTQNPTVDAVVSSLAVDSFTINRVEAEIRWAVRGYINEE